MEKIRKIANILFYFGLTVELLILIIDKSAVMNPIEGALFRITFLLFLCKVCLTKYSLKEWLCILAFGLLGLVVYANTSENVILRIVVFVASIKGMDSGKILRYVLWVTLAGCMVIALLSFTGIMGALSIADEYRMGVIESRYCFGMGHPNAAHCMFLMIVLLILYVYRKKLTLYIFLGLLIGNCILFYYTDSKTGMGATSIAILMGWILHKGVSLQKAWWVYLLGILVFVFCIGISIWAAKYSIEVWSNPVLKKVDTLFSGRMTNLYWDTESHFGAISTWSLFAEPQNLTFYFDMGWVRMFFWFGIIPASIFAILHILLIIECFRKKDYMGLTMIVVLSIYTIVEAHIISVYIARNYILFLFGAYWYDMLHAGSTREEYWWQGYRLFRKEIG